MVRWLSAALVLLSGCFDLSRAWDTDGGLTDLGDGRADQILFEMRIDGPPLDITAGEDGAVDIPLTPDLSPDIGPPNPGVWVAVTAKNLPFQMGSPPGELCREPIDNGTETPHLVTLGQSFEILSTEVTQQEFFGSTGWYRSSRSGCADCPVDSVTWSEAAYYCNQLTTDPNDRCYDCDKKPTKVDCWTSSFSGPAIYACKGYRLPTDAEWEYAYRAGTTTALYNGPLTNCQAGDGSSKAIAWYAENAGQTQPIAQKQPNKWGLFDMAGNVWEWCHDDWQLNLGSAPKNNPVIDNSDNRSVLRGGAYDSPAGRLRGADRAKLDRATRNQALGFRCVRSLP